jgi:hypothetical protein
MHKEKLQAFHRWPLVLQFAKCCRNFNASNAFQISTIPLLSAEIVETGAHLEAGLATGEVT